MSDEGRIPQIATSDLQRKLIDLERRADCLEKQYNSLIKRAGDLEYWTNSYVLMVERERKVACVIDLLMRRDNRSKLLLDYICIFFEILVKKLNKQGIKVSNTKELWEGLSVEETKNKYSAITSKLGFSKTEQEALMIVFEVVHDRDFSVLNVSESLIGNMRSKRFQADDKEERSYYDTDVSSLFLYLQIQDDLQTSVRAALRRAVAVAHCGLMGTDDTETSFDMSEMSSPDLVSRFLTSTPKSTGASRSTSAVEPSSSSQPEADPNVRPIRSAQNASCPQTEDCTEKAVGGSDGVAECNVRIGALNLTGTTNSDEVSPERSSTTADDSSTAVSSETSRSECETASEPKCTSNGSTLSDSDVGSSISMNTESKASINSKSSDCK